MARTNIFRTPDGDPILDGWFDPDLAERYDEATRLVGIDYVSILTGDPAQHQTLYRTPEGRWVLHRWSQWEGDTDTYEFIDAAKARIWLVTCHHDRATEAHFGELPDEAGPGVSDAAATAIP
ncbi:hypothetical protein [Nonomuraea sp. NPDC049758]|uniref:hypothetical protein n=1 Tax=Nonomuraea sp. NPDC049758 TaxID=3154360 RepID=UPI00342DBC55